MTSFLHDFTLAHDSSSFSSVKFTSFLIQLERKAASCRSQYRGRIEMRGAYLEGGGGNGEPEDDPQFRARASSKLNPPSLTRGAWMLLM